MVKLKKRNCPECNGEMQPKLINLLYKKNDSDMQIDIVGIPANVCLNCFYRIIPGEVAKYIDSLVDPFFEFELSHKKGVLPSPHIGIQFPMLEREILHGG